MHGHKFVSRISQLRRPNVWSTFGVCIISNYNVDLGIITKLTHLLLKGARLMNISNNECQTVRPRTIRPGRFAPSVKIPKLL